MTKREKLILNGLFLFAWIGLFLTGPEEPFDSYTDFQIVFGLGVVVLSVISTVRAWSKLIQERDAERLKHILERRDRRTNR